VRRRRGIVAAGFALVAIGALALGAAASAAPRSFYGVVPQTPLADTDFERMGEARVGMLRFELFWAGADPTAAADDYDWSAADRIIGSAARNGIRALPFVYSTPAWVAGLDGHSCGEDSCNPFAPRGRAALAAWKDFLRAAVGRYGPRGAYWEANPDVPRLPVRAWQLWNEQNSPTFYAPKPNLRNYARLLDAGHAAITAIDAHAEIVLGGMFGTPLGGRRPAISAWDFLDQLYRVKGTRHDFDGVAAHPYASKLDKVLSQIKAIRKEMKRAGDGDTSLWITELGWASGGPPNPLNRGLAGQAERLADSFRYFERKRRGLDIRTVAWYSWRDDSRPDAPLCEWCPKSGLLTDDLAPKPALKAFTRLTGGS
jgi:hypothetical protein